MELDERKLNEQELDDEVRAFVRRQVALAELPCAAIVTETVEYLDGEAEPDAVESLAWRITTEELTAHLAAHADWPEVTDSDRLTAAFRGLNASGIVARENFTCCQNCGVGEIGAEVAKGETARGYAFYHQQDAERGAEGSSVWIAYGLFDQPPSAEIGHEVAAALRGQGLTVDWNGDTGKRIRVPMTWRRRRTGRLAAVPTAVADDLVIDVELLDRWTGVFAPADGAMSAARLTSLFLPWLPAQTPVRLSTGDASVVVRRKGDALVAEFADPAVPARTVGRYDGMDLVRRLRGDSVPGRADRPGTDFLEVNYEHAGGGAQAVALELPETLELLRRLRPRTRDFLSCGGRSGGCVQMHWEGGRLWLETPDPDTATSTGRHVTVAEAERMITILATEDRVAVAELGDVETKAW